MTGAKAVGCGAVVKVGGALVGRRGLRWYKLLNISGTAFDVLDDTKTAENTSSAYWSVSYS